MWLTLFDHKDEKKKATMVNHVKRTSGDKEEGYLGKVNEIEINISESTPPVRTKILKKASRRRTGRN